jgi:hypothetical protein
VVDIAIGMPGGIGQIRNEHGNGTGTRSCGTCSGD